MSVVDYNRKLRVSGSYDVTVAGGGFAGVSAAIASARRGAKTLLIEHYGFLGGTATAGGVCGFWATIEGLGDIFDDVLEELEKLNAVGEWRGGQGKEFLKYNPPGLRFEEEYLKYILQDLVLKNGVELRLHSRVVDVIKNGDRVEHVVVHGKSGVEAMKAEIVVDATGDGDVAALAGAEFKKGRESDGRVLQMSLTFKMWNTGEKVRPILPDGCPEYKSRREMPSFGEGRIGDERLYCNMTRAIGLDPTDTKELTKAEIQVRKQVMSIVHYLQTHGYPTYKLASTATQIGVREGRRITGDYILTEEDIVLGREFPDVIAVGTSQIDFHNIDSYGPGGSRLEKVPSYQIPYRCILVKGIENMLTAGKCISGDQVAQSSYRMIPTCGMMGQAAGTAAALAVKQKAELREINIKTLQEILRNDGMKFSGVPPFYQKDIPEATVKGSVSRK